MPIEHATSLRREVLPPIDPCDQQRLSFVNRTPFVAARGSQDYFEAGSAGVPSSATSCCGDDDLWEDVVQSGGVEYMARLQHSQQQLLPDAALCNHTESKPQQQRWQPHSDYLWSSPDPSRHESVVSTESHHPEGHASPQAPPEPPPGLIVCGSLGGGSSDPVKSTQSSSSSSDLGRSPGEKSGSCATAGGRPVQVAECPRRRMLTGGVDQLSASLCGLLLPGYGSPPQVTQVFGSSTGLAVSEGHACKGDEEFIEKNGEAPPHPRATKLFADQSHDDGTCKPCLYFYRGLCHKGGNCTFCHWDHDRRTVLGVRPSKRTRACLLRRGRRNNPNSSSSTNPNEGASTRGAHHLGGQGQGQGPSAAAAAASTSTQAQRHELQLPNSRRRRQDTAC
mmetsp:Transcript_81346/g.178835  ORF Transcript_81346/g.178835 Transcript_81346/m.178835 type:complete len:393 (+) Transcript_81346:667-1845(+)